MAETSEDANLAYALGPGRQFHVFCVRDIFEQEACGQGAEAVGSVCDKKLTRALRLLRARLQLQLSAQYCGRRLSTVNQFELCVGQECARARRNGIAQNRSEEHTSELQSRG